jgi:hypothetical protein
MKIPERAAQAWSVLALAAHNRQTLTYEMLGKLTGMHPAGLGVVLEPIQSYCLLNNLPADAFRGPGERRATHVSGKPIANPFNGDRQLLMA